MMKKSLLVSVLAIFLLPQTLLAEDFQASKCPLPDTCRNIICVPEGYKASFTLKFKEAPEAKALEDMLGHLSLPGVRFSNLVLSADGHYSLDFQVIGSMGREIKCFQKDKLDGLMSHIRDRLPKLTAIKLNRHIPYIHRSIQKDDPDFSVPF